MIVLGVAVASVAAFFLSSLYYVALSPVEARVLGDRAPGRGAPAPWRVVTELLRTALVAVVLAWLADRADLLSLPGSLLLALVAWVGFPFVLLTGSVIWEKVSPVTAAMHAGDWLLKLLLVGAVVGALN